MKCFYKSYTYELNDDRVMPNLIGFRSVHGAMLPGQTNMDEAVETTCHQYAAMLDHGRIQRF